MQVTAMETVEMKVKCSIIKVVIGSMMSMTNKEKIAKPDMISPCWERG